MHFLDRELGESVQWTIGSEAAEEIFRVLLVGTSSWLYAGMSLLWESPAASGDLRALVDLLVESEILGVLSSHPTPDEFLASRQRLYASDQARYPMYFNRALLRDPVRATVVLDTRTTDTLAMRFAQRASGATWARELHHDSDEVAKQAIMKAILEREDRAVTYTLFRPYVDATSAGPEIADRIRLEISREYTLRYVAAAEGDIPTGITSKLSMTSRPAFLGTIYRY
jgi:hypothetical protein